MFISSVFLQKSLFAKLILLAIAARLSFASPVSTSTLNQRAEVPCDLIDMYTTKYFQDNVLWLPPDSTCLFYTRGMTAIARDFAKKGTNRFTTIWDIWPCHYYNDNTEDLNNPLRCIMGDKSVQRDYFARMSRSMTTLCNNFATVIHSNDDYDNPPMDGIWGAVELPQLQLPKDQQYKGEVEVESVAKSDETADRAELIWHRPISKREDGKPGLVSRPLVIPEQPYGYYNPEELEAKFGWIDW